jgi:hypothetical protein
MVGNWDQREKEKAGVALLDNQNRFEYITFGQPETSRRFHIQLRHPLEGLYQSSRSCQRRSDFKRDELKKGEHQAGNF